MAKTTTSSVSPVTTPRAGRVTSECSTITPSEGGVLSERPAAGKGGKSAYYG